MLFVIQTINEDEEISWIRLKSPVKSVLLGILVALISAYACLSLHISMPWKVYQFNCKAVKYENKAHIRVHRISVVPWISVLEKSQQQ